MAKFGVLIEVVLEAESEIEAASKVAEVCTVFESFSIDEGPDKIEDEESSPVEDEDETKENEEE